MSDLGSSDLEAYAERTGIPLAAPDDIVPVAAAAVVGEAITLDLGSGAAAWDDSELVNAWDAAVEEFKLHNPGPGTWLDKATAALAIGKPLPGAKHGESKWYTETPSAKPTPVNPYAAQPQSQRSGGGAYTEPPAHRKKSTIKSNLKRKRKRDSQYAPSADPQRDDDGGSVDMSLDDETSPPRARHAQPAHPGSPAYTPNSPTLYPSTTPAGPPLPDRLRAPANPYLPHHPHSTTQRAASPTTSGIYPPMGASNAVPLTREEATTRAVNAQWWAGYWFAMSEVMPSVAQLEQTQEALQR